ncbi:aminotransferase class IV [Patescibacteria group bacterium]
MNRECYFNGEFIKLGDIKINPYDLGFLRGYGVFDVMRTVNGKPFLIKEHWDRLVNSAKELNLNISVSEKEFNDIVERLIENNDLGEMNIRTVLTGGVSDDAFSLKGEETLLVTVEKLKLPVKDVFKKGARVITEDYKRFIPRAKISNYIAAIRRQDKKHRAGAIEIIYIDDGNVLEASTSNFFIVKDGEVMTTRKGILLGTIRNLVIDLAKKNGLSVAEREISVDEMLKADEAFITATNKGIIPIISIDDKLIGNGKVGGTTKKLMSIFGEYLKKY